MLIIYLIILLIVLAYFGYCGPSLHVVQAQHEEGVLSLIYIIDLLPIGLSFWDPAFSHQESNIFLKMYPNSIYLYAYRPLNAVHFDFRAGNPNSKPYFPFQN